MALSDKKILTSERNAAYVKSNQGRRLNGTVKQNKDAFDKFPQLIMDKYNELVDLLTALGLDSIVTDISSRYTKTETDTKISTETNDLIETIQFTKADGKFKITTKGGTVTTIDTDLEKIPASFELIESEGKTYLRITNQDGTYTQTDVTSLLNVYTFSDSDTIDFTESPKYAVTAIIKPNSITLDHLSLAAVSTLEGYVSAAAGSATAAAGSATAAETSANNADTFAKSSKNYSEAAKASKEAATQSATTAGEKATVASQKATAAENSQILAQSYAKGGTGTRTGEDTDNAKYYMEQAKAAAGGDFATRTELAEGLETKVDKVSGKQLSTNDYTTADKDKVANLPSNTNTELEKKVDKVSGKGLSANDYTTTDKDKVANLPSNTKTELAKKGNAALITANNKSVPVSAWTSDTTYTDFPFRAGITITGCTANHKPDVTFSLTDAVSGNYAPIAESYAGGIYIYAAEKPTAALTIPTISLLQEVNA